MKRFLVLCISSLFFISLYADEGMWMLNNLNQKTVQAMKELGLKMSPEELYNPQQPSLKDAVVSFGGFCSGVVVSKDGLVFTNHHCGFDAIRQHSSVEHDYLKNGFVASSKVAELPNPDLYVSFLVRTENVTERVLNAVTPDMKETDRLMVVDSMMLLIQDEGYAKDSLLRYIVSPYSGGNEYYLSIYKDYNDVRLVFAPPSSVGKFGGDTDNWVWPRHTGDFSVFRIYADKDNNPAAYSPENVPYRPDYAAPISLQGYKEGSFSMTIGYPGETNRYLSSFGIEERVYADNAAMATIRGIKQAIWKEAMENSDSIRIKYSSKYATSSNYWKNSIGMNRAIKELGVIEQKRALEASLREWIQQAPAQRNKYIHVLTDLELAYRNRKEAARAAAFFGESFFNSSDVLSLALGTLNFDFEGDEQSLEANVRDFFNAYRDIDLLVDKDVLVAILESYRSKVDTTYLPDVYHTIHAKYHGDYRNYVESLYSHSRLTSVDGFERLLRKDSTFSLFEDPVGLLALDLLVKFYDITQQIEATSEKIKQAERMLNAAVREMKDDSNYYPDANSTMRLSFGFVGGYAPKDAVCFDYYTTTKGIFEKVREYKGDRDFEVEPALLELLKQKTFDKYADATGEMNVCFISNNDITGGNSGSAMFNGDGELIGLAFDGNWEAMSGNVVFEPVLQKCIGVDIRYVLFIMDKYAGASHLVQELELR